MAAVGVVIPAHNEERTIVRLLHGLADLAGDAEVVVVCNGCTDATAAVARAAAPWVRVVEVGTASKPLALTAGDRTISATSRLYLDADVQLASDAVRQMCQALGGAGVEAVAPTPRYDTTGASPLVRSHYRVWTALQAASRSLSGTGAIMISARGRARFDAWPDVIADDYFLDGLFEPSEKRRLRGVDVFVTLPRGFRQCVSRRARVHQGNRDVVRSGLRSAHGSVGGAGFALLALVRSQPELFVHLPGHFAVVAATRMLSAWRRIRGTSGEFHRDEGSRTRPRRN